MVITSPGRYLMRNQSVMVIGLVRYGIAVGHVEDTLSIYSYWAKSGETKVRGYDVIRRLDPEPEKATGSGKKSKARNDQDQPTLW